MTQIQHFIVHQGSSFQHDLFVTDENGVEWDLTDYTPRAQMRREAGTEPFFTMDTEVLDEPEEGVIRLSLEFEDTKNIPSGRYVYDVEIEDADGVEKILRGTITVVAEKTKEDQEEPEEPYTNDDLISGTA